MLIQSSELIARPGKGTTLSPLVTKMRDVLAEASGDPWYAWAVLGGRPYGAYVLSTRAENYAGMIGASMKVAASAAWAELAPSADGVLAAPASTVLAEVVAVTGTAAAPKQFTMVTSATARGTDFGRAMAWSIEIAEHVSRTTGQSVTVATAAAGAMFTVAWISGVDTPDDVDASNNALNTNAEYMEMMSDGGPLFIAGSADRVLLARMP